LDYVSYDSDISRMDLSLIKKEIKRMIEFGEIALNPSEANMLVEELVDAYGLDLVQMDSEEDDVYD